MSSRQTHSVRPESSVDDSSGEEAITAYVVEAPLDEEYDKGGHEKEVDGPSV